MNTNENETCVKSKKTKSKLPNMAFICTTLVLSGIVMMTASGINIIIFLKKISQYQNLTAQQIIHGIILPHMMLLFGMGILAWGIILLIRQEIIKSRVKYND